MSVLIIAEHDNKQLNPATLHAVTAAAKLGKVDLLVAGSSASAVVESAKQVAGVEKVLVARLPPGVRQSGRRRCPGAGPPSAPAGSWGR